MSTYRDEKVAWHGWYVWLWLACAAIFTSTIFVLPFKHWTMVAVACFGVPEYVGLIHSDDGYPPLTYVIRRYLPRWAAFPVIFAVWGAAVLWWFGIGKPWWFGAATGLLGWLTNHFNVTYANPAPPKTPAKVDHGDRPPPFGAPKVVKDGGAIWFARKP